MRRFPFSGRIALVLLACLSAASTALIVRAGGHRSSAQTAALAALAQKPQTVTQAAAAVTTVAASPTVHVGGASGGSGDGSNGSGGSGGSAGSGGDVGDGGGFTGGSASPAPTPSAPTPTPTASSATKPVHRAPAPDAGLPTVGHVFLITLSAPSYRAAFGASSKLSYLHTLAGRGALLENFRSLGHGELADELAMIGGQRPNAATTAGCPTFREFPSTVNANGAGIVPGTGCVYPTTALTIGDQVNAAGKDWAAYVADQGTEACQHPDSGAKTDLALPQAQPGYDLDHNPFVFFHSLLDAGGCIEHDLNLPKLAGALSSPSRTPQFTYVGADACTDSDPVQAPSPTTSTTTSTTGTTADPTTSTTTDAVPTTATSTDAATTTTGSTTSTSSTTSPTAPSPAAAAATWGCPAGDPSGPAAENAFLKSWVPKITRSAAYRKDGVLVIALTGSHRSAHPLRTGAVVLSRYTPAHTRLGASYTPYSLLRSIEDMLDDKPLAHAAGANAFAAATLTRDH